MTKALLKNTFREIKNTKARFISIMAIIALGVGFFAGIKSTSPSMYRLAEDYYNETRLMDFRLVSTAGFTEEDVAAVAATEGVQSVMPSYFADVMTSAEDGGDILRLIALPRAYGDSEPLNTVTVTEGRSAENTGEILVDFSGFAASRHKQGDKIRLSPTAGDTKISGLLKSSEFTGSRKPRTCASRTLT